MKTLTKLSSILLIAVGLFSCSLGGPKPCFEMHCASLTEMDQILAGEDVLLSNCTDDALGYSWDFGDGTVSNMAQPISHLYAQPGVYNVCLTMTESDSSGAYCTSTFCDSVVVGGIRGCSTSFVATIDPYQNHAYFQTYS